MDEGRRENNMDNQSGRTRGLSRRQRAFVCAKIAGLNDLEAAVTAGYAPSTARNTRQKLWSRPGVRAEFESLRERLQAAGKSDGGRPKDRNRTTDGETSTFEWTWPTTWLRLWG